MPGTVTISNSGKMQVLSGGTRVTPVFKRPWHKSIGTLLTPDMLATGKGCPLEEREQADPVKVAMDDGPWMHFKNSNTPYGFHRMVIPQKCLPEAQLRSLGGFPKISSALRIAGEIAKNSGLKRTAIGVHVGWLAGQNLPHLHWHVTEPMLKLNITGGPLAGELDTPISDADAFMASPLLLARCDGYRTGQCAVIPHQDIRDNSEPFAFLMGWNDAGTWKHELAQFLTDLVALYNDKFKSDEGLAPDFNIAINVGDGYIDSITYTPILNHAGFDNHAAVMDGGAFVIAWPHAKTAKWLRGEPDEDK